MALLTRVLVESGLDDALLHHLDRRRDRVEDDHLVMSAALRRGRRGRRRRRRPR